MGTGTLAPISFPENSWGSGSQSQFFNGLKGAGMLSQWFVSYKTMLPLHEQGMLRTIRAAQGCPSRFARGIAHEFGSVRSSSISV